MTSQGHILVTTVTSTKTNIVDCIVLHHSTKLYNVNPFFVDFMALFGKAVLVGFECDFPDFGDPEGQTVRDRGVTM
jgi:hypothetical protein